jgi:hypothetical protein
MVALDKGSKRSYLNFLGNGCSLPCGSFAGGENSFEMAGSESHYIESGINGLGRAEWDRFFNLVQI